MSCYAFKIIPAVEGLRDQLSSTLYKKEITMTSHFIRYIYQNYMKISWNSID